MYECLRYLHDHSLSLLGLETAARRLSALSRYHLRTLTLRAACVAAVSWLRARMRECKARCNVQLIALLFSHVADLLEALARLSKVRMQVL